MKNVLLENVEYQIDKTSFGVWRRYLYPTGAFLRNLSLIEPFWCAPSPLYPWHMPGNR